MYSGQFCCQAMVHACMAPFRKCVMDIEGIHLAARNLIGGKSSFGKEIHSTRGEKKTERKEKKRKEKGRPCNLVFLSAMTIWKLAKERSRPDQVKPPPIWCCSSSRHILVRFVWFSMLKVAGEGS